MHFNLTKKYKSKGVNFNEKVTLSNLIVLALILGLVLAGCSVLSNIGQVPSTEQNEITYLTKGTVIEPNEFKLYAGQDIPVGTVSVWNDCVNLYIK